MDRQGASGKFGLWQANDGLASVWLNVYALDFLQHAREAGFDVQDATMQRGLSWLSQALPQLENENRGYYSQGPQATQAYAFYVVARAGRADPRELRSAFDAIGGAKLGSGFTDFVIIPRLPFRAELRPINPPSAAVSRPQKPSDADGFAAAIAVAGG